MNIDDAIEKIMRRFNFKKTHNVMTELDWWWLQRNGAYEVPTVTQLRSKARDLFKGVVQDIPLGDVSIESGGLRASYKQRVDGRPQLRLEFILAIEDQEIT
jgi:hypothetical protein